MKSTVLALIKKSPDAKKSAQPTTIKPQLATLATQTPMGDDWLHEIKFDGYRIIAVIKSGTVKLYTRNKKDWTDKLPRIVQALSTIKTDCILDGELIALQNGISNFELLQNEISFPKSKNLFYKVFDLPYAKGYDLKNVPLIGRKEILAVVLKEARHPIIEISDHIIGQGVKVFKKSCTLHLEGIISKQAISPYQEKRTTTWLKSKCVHQQEFVIAGFTVPEGSRKYFGSLLLGYYKNKRLHYCGHVGTGFTQALLAELYKKMQKLIQTTCPFTTLPRGLNKKNVTWIKQKLVAEVKFAEQTRLGILRAPSFLGLRLDKPAKIVEQEVAKVMPKKINLTHPNVIIPATQCVTKEQIASYYEYIHDRILPYLKDRPLALLRCPATLKKCFFQKNCTSKDLSSLNKIIIPDHDKKIHYVCANNASDLMHLAQAGVIELHPWGSDKKNIEKPNRIIFDLDPGSDVAWGKTIAGALILRDYLQTLELKSFVKTSGGKGLHLVVPIMRNHTWPEIKSFTLTVAHNLAETHPDLFTAKMGKTKRSGKIFIDYLRNVRGATTVAAYSLRARGSAPVSTPLSWHELKRVKSSVQFTIFNIDKRLKNLKSDPWEGFFSCRQKITKFS